jgi:hypothetical protein
MRHLIIILLTLFVFIESSQACEICGCGNNNFQIGLLPHFQKGFMGLRYTTSHFKSTMSDDPSEYSRDYYQSVELWGGYQFKKIQLMAFMPYLMTKKISDDGKVNSNGVGDLILLGNYRLLSTMRTNESLSKTIRNEFWIGGGIKLPTGVNRIDTQQTDFNLGDFNSQPGTGSIDYLVNITHNFLWNNSGVVTNLSYRFNGENKQHYHFGNRVYLTSSYFRSFKISKITIKPFAGINILKNAVNQFNGDTITGSDGYSVNGSVGINTVFGKMGIMATTFIPISQDMYNGQTKLQSKVTLGLTFSF